MTSNSFINFLHSTPLFSKCDTPQKKIVYILQLLSKTQLNFEFIEATSIESAFQEVSIRYREIKLDKDFTKFDFGLILVVSPDSSSYQILTRLHGKVESITLTNDKLSHAGLDNSQLIVPDNDTAYEVYPSFPYSINSISDFLSFTFSDFRPDIYKLVFFTLISQCIKAVFPLITVYVTTTIVSIGSINLTLQIGFLTLLLSFFAILSLYLQARIIQKLESESDKRAQTAVWDRLMKIDLSYISPYNAADLVSRAASIGQVRTLLSSQNITSFIALLFSFVYLIEMYSYLPMATLTVLPLLAFFILIVYRKSKSGGQLLTGSLTANADLTDISNTILRGYVELRSSNSIENVKSVWTKALLDSALFSYRYRQKDNSLDVLSNTFLSLGFLVSFASILAVSSKELSSPSFLANAIGYTSALTIFCATLSAGTVSIVNSFINVLAYWKRAEPIIFSPIETGYSSNCYPAVLDGDIQISNLSFSYNPDLPVVLNSYSISIAKNKFNCIDIPSGCGTTTLFRILLGLYPITSGNIYFDSHKIEDLLLSSLRSQVKLAPQVLNIPNGNIYRLFKGPLSSDDQSLSDFVNAFGLSNFIASERMGIDTPLSNNGKNFPQKQRQLFSLAFATCEKPSILLVDNCLTELTLKEKISIFSYLLSQGITLVVSDPDCFALRSSL
jgi:ABC-type bacteriocin/lantibiotic exporter with double-glycine peptidase domain